VRDCTDTEFETPTETFHLSNASFNSMLPFALNESVILMARQNLHACNINFVVGLLLAAVQYRCMLRARTERCFANFANRGT
jgi:hypothetical protein